MFAESFKLGRSRPRFVRVGWSLLWGLVVLWLVGFVGLFLLGGLGGIFVKSAYRRHSPNLRPSG